MYTASEISKLEKYNLDLDKINQELNIINGASVHTGLSDLFSDRENNLISKKNNLENMLKEYEGVYIDFTPEQQEIVDEIILLDPGMYKLMYRYLKNKSVDERERFFSYYQQADTIDLKKCVICSFFNLP